MSGIRPVVEPPVRLPARATVKLVVRVGFIGGLAAVGAAAGGLAEVGLVEVGLVSRAGALAAAAVGAGALVAVEREGTVKAVGLVIGAGFVSGSVAVAIGLRLAGFVSGSVAVASSIGVGASFGAVAVAEVDREGTLYDQLRDIEAV